MRQQRAVCAFEADALGERIRAERATAGTPSPPITSGAWNQTSRSTRRARSSAAASSPPPSTRTR